MLSKVSKEVREKLPEFFNRVEKGEVHLYDGAGFTRELTDEMKEKIKEMEGWGAKVIAVTEGTYGFPGDEQAHMLAYIYDDGDYEPWLLDDDESIGFMANVVNDSWDIEEAGSVGIVEIKGMVQRTY